MSHDLNEIKVGELSKDVSSDEEHLVYDILKINQLQALKLRTPLFWVVVAIAIGCTIASTVFIFVWLYHFPPVPASVGVAYISGLTIEAVGVVAIMVRSLFHASLFSERELSVKELEK